MKVTDRRTIFGRILNVGEEADPDSMKQIEKALDNIGVKIREIGDPTSLRPIGEIFKDLSEKWKTLTDVQRQDIAFLSAGQYRKNTFIALMENYGDVVKNTEAAINSEGVAMQKQEIFANSLQASINKLKSTWEELYLTTINSDFIKNFMKSTTGLLSFFTDLSKSIGFLPTALLSIVTALNLFGKFNFSKSILQSVQNFRVQLNLLRMEQTALSTQQSGLVVSSTKLGLMFQALTGKTIAQTLASVGLTVATTALNVALTFGLSMAITGIITAMSSYINRAKEAREEQQKFIADTKQHIQSLNEEVSQSKEYLKTLESSSSTTDQLVEARKALSELFPSIIIGYDNEGKAILANNESIKEQIALKEKQIEIEKKLLREASGYDILQNISEKKQAQDSLQRLASKKSNLNDDLNNLSNLSPLEKEQAKQNPAIYKKRNEEIQQSIADIASEEAKLAQKIQESNDKLRASYISLMPDMTNFSEAQKKIAENYIATAIEGEYTQEKFIQGLQYTLNNEKLLQATEQELINQKKKTNTSTTQQSKSFEELSKQVKDTVTEVKELNDIQSDLAKNNTLSADSLIDLINKYPELLDYIKKTKDGYIVEAEGIQIVKQALVDKQMIALKTELGINDIIKNQLAERLKLYGIDIEAIDTLNKAREASYKVFNKDSNGNKAKSQISMYDAQEYAETNKQLESLVKLKTLKDMLMSGLTIPKVNTGENKKATPDPIPYQDLSNEFLKAYNNQAELDEKQAQSLERQIKIAESAKDYNKQLDLTNKLIDIRKKKITDLEIANKKISADASSVRSQTKYDTTKWFDKNNNVTTEYLKLIKSFEGKTDDASKDKLENIKKIFNALSNLKQGYAANTQEITKQNDLISEQKQSLSDIAKDQIKTVGDTQDKIADLIKKYYDKQQAIAEKAHDKEEKRLEKASKNYKKYIDDNIKELDRQKEAEDYNTDTTDKLKEINEIQLKINPLISAAASGDGDAQSQLEDLNKDLIKKQEELAKTQKDRSYELKKQAYQDEGDLFDRFIDDKKEKNDKQLQDYKDSIEDALSEAKLQTETINGLLKENVKVVTQGLDGEIKTLTLSLQTLFTETGENATTSAKLLEGEFLTSLTKVRDIYKEISTLYNLASGDIKIPKVNTDINTMLKDAMSLVPTSSVFSKAMPPIDIGLVLKDMISLTPLTSMLSTVMPSNVIPNVNTTTTNKPVTFNFENMLKIEGDVTKDSMSEIKTELKKFEDHVTTKMYNLFYGKGQR